MHLAPFQVLPARCVQALRFAPAAALAAAGVGGACFSRLRRRAALPGMCAARPPTSRFKTTKRRASDRSGGSRSSPAAPQARRIVHHEKESRRRDPKFASSPAPSVSAGRGHRRGLDGPTMPKPTIKITNVFLHPPGRWRGEVGGGLFRRRLRHVVGHRWRGIRRCRTRPSHRCRGLKLTERPRNRGRSGPIQMAARRRNKPPPTSPQAQPRHSRSAKSRHARRAKPWHSRSAKPNTPQSVPKMGNRYFFNRSEYQPISGRVSGNERGPGVAARPPFFRPRQVQCAGFGAISSSTLRASSSIAASSPTVFAWLEPISR